MVKKPILHINKDAIITKPVQSSFEISTYSNSTTVIQDNTKVSQPAIISPIRQYEDAKRAQRQVHEAQFRAAVARGEAI